MQMDFYLSLKIGACLVLSASLKIKGYALGSLQIDCEMPQGIQNTRAPNSRPVMGDL